MKAQSIQSTIPEDNKYRLSISNIRIDHTNEKAKGEKRKKCERRKRRRMKKEKTKEWEKRTEGKKKQEQTKR